MLIRIRIPQSKNNHHLDGIYEALKQGYSIADLEGKYKPNWELPDTYFSQSTMQVALGIVHTSNKVEGEESTYVIFRASEPSYCSYEA